MRNSINALNEDGLIVFSAIGQVLFYTYKKQTKKGQVKRVVRINTFSFEELVQVSVFNIIHAVISGSIGGRRSHW